MRDCLLWQTLLRTAGFSSEISHTVLRKESAVCHALASSDYLRTLNYAKQMFSHSLPSPSLPLSNPSLGAQSLYLLQESLVPLRDALHAYNSLPPVSGRTMATTGDYSKFVS